MKKNELTKLNKRLSIIVIVCMIFQISSFSVWSANKAFAATGLRHEVIGGSEVVLGGNYIEVGISKSGSFGTGNTAPTGFHPTNGGVGLRVDGDGFDTGKPPTTGDFFLPGSPEESFTTGYKVGSNTTSATKYTNAERMGEVGIVTVTTDTTSGDTLSALTTGTTNDSNLEIQQKISFKVNDKFFKNTVTYTNKGTSTLYDARYMRSFDPDQDANLNGTYATYNSALENFPQDSRAIARAAGGVTKEPIFFISTDSRARASTFGFSNRDPYDALAYDDDGSKLKSPEVLADKAIAITFALGNLEPGQSTTFEYYTSLDPDYSAGLENIMGSLGARINDGASTTDNLDVIINLSGQNVTEMRFSNDNSTWSSWEAYNSTKAWTLTAGDGTKTVYVQFKDSSDNISNLNDVIEYIMPDVTTPTFSVAGNPTTWTNKDVILSVSASDDGSGLNTDGAYSFDDGSTWTTSNTESFSSNGTINIKVKDNSGNISSKDIIIDKIDKLAPTFTSIIQTPTTWAGDSVTLLVDGATDNGGVGLHSKTYSFSTTQEVYNWQASDVSLAFSENQTVYVYIQDALGNISVASTVNISNIDTTLPNTPIINDSSKFTSDKWYNSTQTVIAAFTTTVGCIETLQYSLNDGEWTNGGSVLVSEEGVNTLKFRVTDELGRSSGEISCPVQIDKTSPGVSTNDSSYLWRNNDFNVTIDYSDAGGSSVNTKEYAVTNSSNTPDKWTSANADISQLISISSEGQWYIHYKVTDEAENSSVGYYGPYKLDKGASTGTISIQPDKTNDGNNYVRSQAVLIKLTGSDNLSLVSQMRFANSENDLTNSTWETFETVKSGFDLTDGNGLKTVYFQLKDNAGNLSEIYSNQIYFDNTKPRLTISQPSKYVAQSGDVITYTVTFEDNTTINQIQGIDSINFGIDKIILSKLGSIDLDKITKTIEDVATDPLKKLIKLSIPSGMSAQGSINFKIAASAALDKAGNLSEETTCGYALNMDNIAPVNQNEILKRDLRVKGGSDITLDSTSENAGGIASDSVRFAPANYSGVSVNSTTITSTLGSSLHINAPLNEGEYYLYVVDSAGNISGASTYKLIVDNSGPTFEISQPSKTIVNGSSELEYLVTFSDDSTIESINSLFVKSKIGFESTGTANAKASIETVTGNDRQRKVKLSYFSGDGSIDNLKIASDVARDSLGNVSLQMIQSTKIIVDNTMPTIPTLDFTEVNGGTVNKILNFVTFKNFWNGVIKVNINASDLGGSNLSKVYYKTSEDGEYTAVTPNTDGNITFELPIGFKGNIWAYSEDGSGNKSALVKSDGTLSENNAPEIVVTPGDLSTWSTKAVTINVKTSDNEGLKAITYSVDGEKKVIDMVTDYTDKQDNKEFTIAVAGDSKGHSVQINVVDLAGNNAATYNNVVKIDSTKPIIASVTGNPSDWTKNSVTLTVNASDVISELAQNAYSFDNGNTWQESNEKVYDQNTEVIVAKVKDVAGNIATYETINIDKIDKTVPNTAVIANKEKYTDDKWFNEKQTITTSFTNTAGCDEKLQYRVDDAAWTDGKVVDINAQGKYVVSFRVIDSLGRTSEEQTIKVNLDNTKPIITGASDSASYFIGRVIKLNDVFGEIAGATYKNGTNTETSFKDSDLFEKAGKYTLTLKDKAGNSQVLSFEIKELPKVQDVVDTTEFKSLLDSIRAEFDKRIDLSEVYKTAIDIKIKALEDRYSQIIENSKIVFHDSKTDVTVTGIDGTSFTPDIYLLVTPMVGGGTSATKFNSASASVESATKNDSALEGKELLALYDVSLFRGNIKIQPNGKVKVKVKIPENLINFTGLDIVHIADDGTVTRMNATVEEGYLVFITSHFSEYGIVGEVAEKGVVEKMPKTGSVIDSNVLVVGGVLLFLMGTVLILRKNRKTKRKA